MSQWRKIALEAVPSCKRAIEESKSPGLMWLELYAELYGQGPDQETRDAQIYDFARRCFKTGGHKRLEVDVWLFFHSVVGAYVVGIEKVRRDLPHRLSLDEFMYWKQWTKSTFTQEQYEEAIGHFSAAKRSATFHRQK